MSENEDFNLKEGEVITVVKLDNGDIRLEKENGKKVVSFYDFEDFCGEVNGGDLEVIEVLPL